MLQQREGVVELDIAGMTCSSCAARIERKLNRADGIRAEVNYATELATVHLAQGASVETAISVVENTGYRASLAGTEAREVSIWPMIRLVTAWALTVPIVVLSMVPPLQFPAWQWVVFAMTIPVVAWCGWPFHRAAFVSLRHGTTTMDTLISLGTLSAMLWSVWALFFGGAGNIGMRMEMTLFGSGHHELYFEVAAAVTAFLLLGRMIESRAKHSQTDALDALARLGAREATRLTGDGEERIPTDQLRVGDRFRTLPGEKIATDGIVVEGSSSIDTAIVTGESMPLAAKPGTDVIGGTINGSRTLEIEATKVGADTELARIAAMLRQAQSGKTGVQRLADKISSFFVPAVIAVAIVTLVTWLLVTGDVEAALSASVATLIIACPCALGLATPTALLIGTTRGSELGMLLRDATVLETARKVDVAILDKTGTLTEGRMRIGAVFAEPYVQSVDLLRIAAAAEHDSDHPISYAVLRAAKASGITVKPAHDVETVTGAGLVGEFEGHSVRVGRPDWIGVDPGKTGALTGTLVAVEYDGAYLGTLMLNDEVRGDAKATIGKLRELGIEPIMVTGDHRAAADEIAQTVGIDRVYAGAVPADKVEHVKRLQAEGRQVAMVGDGVNDAAALAEADLGIAMGSGTDVARASASITLVSVGLERAATGIELARATLRIIKQNLFWAFAYNTLAIPLAALGFLSPLIAGLAMALSSLMVVGNSLRLRRFGR
ncbi:cation-translocating P-type ATPase [uncultured Agrococcus sp.]|uniref:heavy metal translocating P-type ATPase n=1 Tax=uncultured Agrococcus sp. TaxID=382258 RepID=UPI0025F2EF7A|nr:heavy metal translocating P-type ATPase [uncultured Agrococcus sp.]